MQFTLHQDVELFSDRGVDHPVAVLHAGDVVDTFGNAVKAPDSNRYVIQLNVMPPTRQLYGWAYQDQL